MAKDRRTDTVIRRWLQDVLIAAFIVAVIVAYSVAGEALGDLLTGGAP